MSLLFELFIILDHFFKNKTTDWVDFFLKNIIEIKTSEDNENFLIKFVLRKKIKKLKIMSGNIVIERYMEVSKVPVVVTKYRIYEEKKYEFKDVSEFEIGIKKGKTLGYLDSKGGVVDGPGFILNCPYMRRALFLFTDDTVMEEFKLKEDVLKLKNEINVYSNLLEVKDGEVIFHVSVFDKGKARVIKLEIEWIYKNDLINPHIFRETISNLEEVGSYEIKYDLKIFKDKNIYVFNDFYFPEKVNFLKLTKKRKWKIFLKLSADLPFYVDKSVKTEFVF
ncbi:MAG: hypothetical protein ABDH37_02795 [Candidatus Hydrothermales bacterium]